MNEEEVITTKIYDKVIESDSKIRTLESRLDGIEKSIDKLVSEFSIVRTEIYKMGERLTWRIIAGSAVGGSVAALLVIFAGR